MAGRGCVDTVQRSLVFESAEDVAGPIVVGQQPLDGAGEPGDNIGICTVFSTDLDPGARGM